MQNMVTQSKVQQMVQLQVQELMAKDQVTLIDDAHMHVHRHACRSACVHHQGMVVLLNASDVLDNVQQTQQPQDGSNSKTRVLVKLRNSLTYSFDETKPLGKGAQGAVCKATSPDGSLIALKIVQNSSSRDTREYANLEKIKHPTHPSVVELVGSAKFKDASRGNLLAIGMALVVGESYVEYLKDKGKIDWKIAADEFRQLITGMQAVHQQVPSHTEHKSVHL